MTAPGAGPPTVAPTVEVTIDEVVLRGVPPEQSRDVLAHLEARLAELAGAWVASSAGSATLADRAESSRRLPAIDAPAASAAAVGTAAALGTAVADAVWHEIGGGASGGGGRR